MVSKITFEQVPILIIDFCNGNRQSLDSQMINKINIDQLLDSKI